MTNTYYKLFRVGFIIFILTSLIVGGLFSFIYIRLKPIQTTTISDTVYITHPVVKIVDTIEIITPVKIETPKPKIIPSKPKIDTTSKIVNGDTIN